MKPLLVIFSAIIFSQILAQTCLCQEKPGSNLKAEKTSDQVAKLGEGSIWDYNKQVLYWIDIEEGKLFEYNPSTGRTSSHFAGKKIGCIVPETGGTVILALEDGIYRMFLQNDSLEFITKPASLRTDQRFNDGKCDPQGRFWLGSIGPENTCFLYCLDNKGEITERLDGITISNGIIWSPDSTKMYYVDTRTSNVRQFDFDGKTGSISNSETIIDVPGNLGAPDGMTIDNEGKLWIAFWGGYGVYQYDPANGKLLQKIDVPAKNITSCAFGGSNLDILFITTASIGMTKEEGALLPDAGKLFMIKTGAKGIKANSIKLRKKTQ